MGSKVVCTATHPVDLDDGRSLPPGETADNVDLSIESNASLLEAGQIYELKDNNSQRLQTEPSLGSVTNGNDEGGSN